VFIRVGFVLTDPVPIRFRTFGRY